MIPGAALHAATTPGVNGSIPGFDWTLRTTSPVPDNPWIDVTYGTVSGNPLFVAVGTDGKSMTSPDGVAWTANAGVTAHNWDAVTHNGSNQFVAVGAYTTSPVTLNGAMYSADGVNWTTATTPHEVPYSSVAYGSGNYVAVSSSISATVEKLVMTSPDGITWTARPAAEQHAWRDVAFGNGVFVAVTNLNVTNQVMRSIDNGETWTAVASPATKKGWQSVTYGNGRFVATAISGTGERVMTSDDDGQTWTLRSTPANNNWYSVSYGNGLFVAVADNGTDRVMTSPDGITWTARPAAANQIWFGLTYGDGRFVAVANSGAGNRVMTSPNGFDWTSRTSAADNQWQSVTYGNGLFVAVANTGAGNRVMTSPDGITWTSRTSAADSDWFGVTYGNGQFVATSNTGELKSVMTSGGPCGDGLAYTTNQWLMAAVPCQPTSNTVAGSFGNSPTANFVAGAYDVATTGWVMYERNVAAIPSAYVKLGSADAFVGGDGQWLKSGTAPVGSRVTVTDGTPWPVTAPTGCQSANGCVVHPVTTVSFDNRYNLVGNPFPYPVDWAKVRVRVGGASGTVYTPTEAQTAGYLSNQIWIWNGNAYETWSDTGPTVGNLKYFQSFWVNVLPGAAGQTVELLIPAEVSTHSQVVPLEDRLYAALRAGAERLLDWLIPSATAAESAADSLEPGRAPGREGGPHPAPGREASDPTLEYMVNEGLARGLGRAAAVAAAHERARAEGREWHVRLKLDQPATGFKDHTNTLGQRLSAQDGYDPADLVEMAPFAKPFLTLVFPHPEWGERKGDYASDFRAAQRYNPRGMPLPGLPAGEWIFEIRADEPGGEVVLSWDGPPQILARSRLSDPTTGLTLNPRDPAYEQGYRLTLTSATHRLVWRFLGAKP